MIDLSETLLDKVFVEKNGSEISKESFLAKIHTYIKFLNKNSAKRIAIGINEPAEFSAALFAIISLKKEVVLLPNQQVGTIKEYSEHYDLYLEKIDSKSSVDVLPVMLYEDSMISLFTSGSQGNSKKIVKKFSNLLNECEALDEVFHYENITVYSSVSHQHIYGLLFRVLWPLLKGKTVSNFNIRYSEELESELIGENKFFISSPAYLNRLPSDLKTPNHFKKIFSSGGPLKQSTADFMHSIWKQYPMEVYGSTETGGIAYKDSKDENKTWNVFPRIKLSVDSRNCLAVTSDYIRDGYFQTNDRVELLDESHFILKSRIDRVFKIEEKRISLDELEQKISLLESVQDVRCVVIPTEKRNIIACVMIYTSEDKKVDKIRKIKDHLLQYYEAILLPKKYRFVSEIPYNEQSKLSLSAIKELFDESEF